MKNGATNDILKEAEPFTNILGVRVAVMDMERALQRIAGWIERDERQYVCVAATHLVTECARDPNLRRIHNQAGMVTPDGMPLVWLSHHYGHPEVRRVYGPDLLLATCERSLSTGWSHYFYGGAPGVAERLVERLSLRFPGLKVMGTDSPPYRPLTPEEDAAAVARINASHADIVWVGLGAPKQEYWMGNHVGQVLAPVMLGVGAAFDFHSGAKRQAPRWMRHNGLEWLFRLLSEPKRLGKRYLFYNSLFLWLTFLQLSGLRRFPLEEA